MAEKKFCMSFSTTVCVLDQINYKTNLAPIEVMLHSVNVMCVLVIGFTPIAYDFLITTMNSGFLYEKSKNN